MADCAYCTRPTHYYGIQISFYSENAHKYGHTKCVQNYITETVYKELFKRTRCLCGKSCEANYLCITRYSEVTGSRLGAPRYFHDKCLKNFLTDDVFQYLAHPEKFRHKKALGPNEQDPDTIKNINNVAANYTTGLYYDQTGATYTIRWNTNTNY